MVRLISVLRRRRRMPILNITLIEGRSQAQKDAMYREVTDAVCRSLGAPAESVRIIVNEIPAGDFAAAGVSKASAKAKAPETTSA
ncbi:MAG: 2-hydroxymuconate tautomerase [Rhodobacteraceae bacterium]|nr:2-hydroxymuconate tautomerase [Paracoccaceae bacterium]